LAFALLGSLKYLLGNSLDLVSGQNISKYSDRAPLSMIWVLRVNRTLNYRTCTYRCKTYQRLSSSFEIFLTNFKLGVEQPHFSKGKLQGKNTKELNSTFQMKSSKKKKH